jgi:hypothetical protein
MRSRLREIILVSIVFLMISMLTGHISHWPARTSLYSALEQTWEMYKQYHAEWAAWAEDPNNLRGRLWSLPPPKPPPLADRLHPTLSSWLKNMNKLDGLINRLQELASSAPPEHRSQLLNKVVALRTTFKRQQERFIAFLQLSEEYADKYLQDISTEIQQQGTVLDNLEERLEAANKLHGEAADLQMYYQSRTVANMNDLRATGKAYPVICRSENAETFFQQFRSHFHRTIPCSAR